MTHQTNVCDWALQFGETEVDLRNCTWRHLTHLWSELILSTDTKSGGCHLLFDFEAFSSNQDSWHLGQEGFAGTDGAMPTYPSYGISAIILYGCSSRDYNLKRQI